MSLFYVVIKNAFIFSNTTFQWLHSTDCFLFKRDKINKLSLCVILSFLNCKYVCVHIHMWVDAFLCRCTPAHMCTCMWKSRSILRCHLQKRLATFFEIAALFACNSAMTLDQQASEHRPFSCVCLHSTGIPSTCHHVLLFRKWRGSNSGP